MSRPKPVVTRTNRAGICRLPDGIRRSPWPPSAPREVLGDGPSRVPAVDRHHAPARVGAGPAQVETGDRRPGREAVLPHLVREDLALEDVTARQTDACFDVGRPEHLAVG